MSRLIVKNLPKKVSSKKLHDLFSSKGHVTDFQLKYTKDGVFRQFAFIGYKTEEEAKAAQEYFHMTYVEASKIQVEICANLGDTNKPRAWSKHTKEKLLEKQEDEKIEIKDTDKQDKKKKKKKKKEKNSEENDDENELQNFPDELKNDTLFAEFLDVNKARNTKPLWSDVALDAKVDEIKEESDSESQSENEETSIAKKTNISDVDYLKSKIETSKISDEKKTNLIEDNKVKVEKVVDDSFTVKLRNLPFLCKKNQIKQFFHPLKLTSLRLPPKLKGFAYVKFKSEKDMNLGLNKNKCVLGGRKIDVIKYEKKQTEKTDKSKYQKEDKIKLGEEIAETGRIFVRNLDFGVTDSELQDLFSKYGPISETHVPIDSYTKKRLGFAFVTFVFPEHAVKAFSELDGTIFQGRVLHLIPAKPKIEISVGENELSYKKKKDAKLKALSGSSHNWNILFLGMNAVADVISKKYDIDKSQLLNDDSKESVAVRMALGETQLVVETRKFLIENGVQLDAFSQAASERSKTVILAKNLPANTSSKEILDLFSKHGLVTRVILPPSGISALIEFQEPTEAKLAFNRLAYTRFRYLPLYLEWAPMNIFRENIPQKDANDESEISEQKSVTSDSATHMEENEAQEFEPGSILFVKNLNFETTEDSLRKHFKKCAPHSVSISRKKDFSSGKLLSMGFGFVQFQKKSYATKAFQDYQNSTLDGHNLELKFSNKVTLAKAETFRKKAQIKEQKTSKILIRNIPFEVTEKEIRDLFKGFGMLKSVRLPKKFSSEGTHRGFGFIDFTTKSDAKKAFDALCHSTHLLGRRLVLEWANPEVDEVSELRKKTARDFYTGGSQSKLKKSKFLQDVATARSNENDDDDDDDDD